MMVCILRIYDRVPADGRLMPHSAKSRIYIKESRPEGRGITYVKRGPLANLAIADPEVTVRGY